MDKKIVWPKGTNWTEKFIYSHTNKGKQQGYHVHVKIGILKDINCKWNYVYCSGVVAGGAVVCLVGVVGFIGCCLWLVSLWSVRCAFYSPKVIVVIKIRNYLTRKVGQCGVLLYRNRDGIEMFNETLLIYFSKSRGKRNKKWRYFIRFVGIYIQYIDGFFCLVTDKLICFFCFYFFSLNYYWQYIF